MNKKETIKRILSINNDYDKKWLETHDEDFLNKLLIDNMIVSQGVSNKLMMYFYDETFSENTRASASIFSRLHISNCS